MNKQKLKELIDTLEKDIIYFQEKKENLERAFRNNTKELDYVIKNYASLYLEFSIRVQILIYINKECQLFKKDEKFISAIKKELFDDFRYELNSLSSKIITRGVFSMEALYFSIRLKVISSLFEMGGVLYNLESILQEQR